MKGSALVYWNVGKKIKHKKLQTLLDLYYTIR